ncbi:MAG: hypothetical protein ACK559_05460, partial [bacterium]
MSGLQRRRLGAVGAKRRSRDGGPVHARLVALAGIERGGPVVQIAVHAHAVQRERRTRESHLETRRRGLLRRGCAEVVLDHAAVERRRQALLERLERVVELHHLAAVDPHRKALVDMPELHIEGT